MEGRELFVMNYSNQEDSHDFCEGRIPSIFCRIPYVFCFQLWFSTKDSMKAGKGGSNSFQEKHRESEVKTYPYGISKLKNSKIPYVFMVYVFLLVQ